MRAGRLRERVSFQRKKERLDGFGNDKGRWLNLFPDWPAEVLGISGREFFASQQPQSDVTIRVTCRYSEELLDVNAKDRIQHGELIYDIRAPLPNKVRGEIVFMCTQHSVS